MACCEQQASEKAGRSTDGRRPWRKARRRKKKEGPELDTALLNQTGIIGALERRKFQEFKAAQAYNAMLRFKKEHPDIQISGELAAHEKIMREQATSLRQLEFAVMEYKKKIGELVEFEPLASAWVRVAVGVRNAVEGIAVRSIPRIRKYLHHPDMAGDVERIIDEIAREALNNVPDSMPDGSDQ